MSHTYIGHVTIEPALNWAQIRTVTKGIQAAVAKGGGSRYTKGSIADATPETITEYIGFGLVIEEGTRDTEDGTLLVKSASELRYRSTESGCYYINEAEIVQLVVKAAPKSKCNGTLVMIHEEATQGTKTTVKDNKVSATSGIAYMRWADGTEDRVSTLL